MAWVRLIRLRPWLSSFRSALDRREGLTNGWVGLLVAPSVRLFCVLIVFLTTAAPTAMPPVAAAATDTATIWPSRLSPSVVSAWAVFWSAATWGFRLPLARSRVPLVGAAPLSVGLSIVKPTPAAPLSCTQ